VLPEPLSSRGRALTGKRYSRLNMVRTTGGVTARNTAGRTTVTTGYATISAGIVSIRQRAVDRFAK